ncbi:MAG: glycosyltransferase [Acidimicrobiales bacterium]
MEQTEVGLEERSIGDLSRTEDAQVLQVITTTVARGAERFAIALEGELADRGMSVRTVALAPAAIPGIDVPTLGETRLGRRTLLQLRKAARSASVVVAHGSTSLPASAIALMGLRVPLVYRNIGDPYYWSSGSLSRRLRTRLFLSRAEAVVSLTAETGRRLTEYYAVDPAKIVPIPRGVAASEFPRRNEADRAAARDSFGIGPDVRVAVAIGALSPEKDVVNAVDALGRLPSRWHLLIAGDGPDRARVAERADLVAPDRIQLLGAIDNPSELLAAADVLVLPSLTEGLPGVVIEAGMVGVPSVSTDTGFVSEIIDDGLNGLIVPTADSAALANAVVRAEERLDELGAAAHRSVSEGYSLASTADRWFELLSGWADSGSVRRNTPGP